MGAGALLRERYLVFHLEDRTYCVSTTCVEEIVPMAELIRVPSAPAFLLGFLDVGGQLVAVISLRQLMGMAEREPDLYTPLVILKTTSQPIALEVDGVTRIIKLGEDELIPLSEGCSLNHCATAVARLDGAPVVVLAPERLVLHEEQRRVAELAALAKTRLDENVTVDA
jgi:purine-binding chemotaxis protein CheW